MTERGDCEFSLIGKRAIRTKQIAKKQALELTQSESS